MPDFRLSVARLIPALSAFALVAALYLAREFLLPIALAIMIAFLLAPFVRWLEKHRFSRIPAVITVSLVAFASIACAIYVVVVQVIDLANRLPGYEDNLREKISALRVSKDGPVGKVTETIHELSEELEKPDDGGSGAEEAEKEPAVKVEVMDRPDTAFSFLATFVTPMLAPLGTAAVVVVFVIFILLGREDLRDRFIHLVGQGRLRLTTQALNDAGKRVSRYLLAQCIVNVTYGIPIGFGLWWIGIPNAVLWGLLATLLRFIPYIGPWMAAVCPIILSFAVERGWTAPALTITLFVVLELISNNVVEPWLYGSSTGLSPMAIIVSAVFWTWIWGTAGLLLATPLTVCIAVLGKHIPALRFIDVLLSEKPPIAAGDRVYQRLLAGDVLETYEIAETYVAEHSAAEFFDDVLVPTLRQAESDVRLGSLDEADRHALELLTRRLITDLDIPRRPEADLEAVRSTVLILPATNETDEISGLMLARLLGSYGVPVDVASSKSLTSELIERSVQHTSPLLCISAVSSNSGVAAGNLCKRLHARLPGALISIGLWRAEAEKSQIARLERAQPHEVFTSLQKAACELAAAAELELEPSSAAESEATQGAPQPAAQLT